MTEILKMAKNFDDILKPFGEIDLLLFYGIVGEKLRKFLKNRELATKIWMPNDIYLIKRGTKLEPLFIDEFLESITLDFLERRKKHLEEVRKELTPGQIKVWQYFFPRKLMDFFYATNSEKGKNIDRIFFDIDRGFGVSSEEAQQVTLEFVKVIKEDESIKDLISGEPFVSWTGSSFHVYLFLKKPKPPSFYEKNIQYLKSRPDEGLTSKWCKILNKKFNNVIPGHEKIKGKINIDPSQTPPGKLCRVPLGSLHMKDAKTIDGISIPLKVDMLEDEKLVGELKNYSPKILLESIDDLTKRLPKIFQ
ncbi:MAG: hypothetical protein QXY45_02920 [Candidatus Aenigmatarchaeota archaeon]